MAVKGVELARKIPDNAEVCRVLAGIPTFTDKFIDEEYGKKERETMMMTRVERIIYNEGYEKGYEDGYKKGYENGYREAYRKAKKDAEKVFGQLNCRFLEEKRYDDLRRATADIEYREQLYREYGLTPLSCDLSAEKQYDSLEQMFEDPEYQELLYQKFVSNRST